MCFANKILDSNYYYEQISKIHLKLQSNGIHYQSSKEEIPFAYFEYNKPRIVRSLIQNIREMKYVPQPATSYQLREKDKVREIFAFGSIDRIMHGVVGRILQEELEKYISKKVYSYLPQKSYVTATHRFARYVRHQCRKGKSSRDQSLYVYCCDIKDYSDSIPLGENARIWKFLREKLFQDQLVSEFEKYLFSLIIRLIRLEVKDSQGSVLTKCTGAATGSPITSVLYNIAARELDELAETFRGGFYARYSDDILYADSDPEKVQEKVELIRDRLAEVGLEVNEDKSEILYLSARGRRNDEYPEIRGVQHLEYLGAHINSRGEVSPNKKASRKFIKNIKRRIRRTHRFLQHDDVLWKGKILCSALNQSLFPRKGQALSQKSVQRILQMTNDRTYLKHIDYLLMRMVAEELSGSSGVKAFRKISPHMIRKDMGLKSLFHMRNVLGADS